MDVEHAKDIVFLKQIPGTQVQYGFTYDNNPIVLIEGEEASLSSSVSKYIMCLLNIEDWDRNHTIREKYEMNMLIAEKIGLSKVINGVKFLSSYNQTIEGKMELVMLEAIPVSRDLLSKKCDTIRDKYDRIDDVI